MPTVQNDWKGDPYIETMWGRDYASVQTMDRSWLGLGEATRVSVPADGLYGVLGGRETVDPRGGGDDSTSSSDWGGDWGNGGDDSIVGSCVGAMGCLLVLFIVMIPVFFWAQQKDKEVRLRRWMNYSYRQSSPAPQRRTTQHPAPRSRSSQPEKRGRHWRLEGSRIYEIGPNGQRTGTVVVDESENRTIRVTVVREPAKPTKTPPKGGHWRLEGSRFYEIGPDGEPKGKEMSLDEATKHWLGTSAVKGERQ